MFKNFDVKCFFLQWHSLNREEQAKYYEMARKERQLHMQMYPGNNSGNLNTDIQITKPLEYSPLFECPLFKGSFGIRAPIWLMDL